MKYKVKFSEQCIKDLKKLDRYTKTVIMNWIAKNLEGCENPRVHGKPLVANRKGQWRYRIGDYRLVCEIHDSELLIYSISIGHRREIYTR